MMNVYRVNDTITISKLINDTDTINEGDYALYLYSLGQRKYLAPSTVTFAVTQPNGSVSGKISYSIRVDSTWNDGIQVFEVHRTTLEEGQQRWSQAIARTIIQVQKYAPSEVIL